MAVQSTAATPVGGNDALYKQRWERTFVTDEANATRIQNIIAQQVPWDTEFKNPEILGTVYIRSAEKHGPREDLRIRSYPESPNSPFSLEYKDNQEIDGHTVKVKSRAIVSADLADKLLWGARAEDAIGTEGRTGEDLEVAKRAIHDIDVLGLRPVVHGTYNRTTYQDADAGIRVTFDRNAAFQGIGELARGGTFQRNEVIFDIKVTGEGPKWLNALLDAELAAGTISVPEAGKGGTAVKAIAKAAKALSHAK
jgi:SPX domain protein involved in polyphosphate accumulation